MNTFRLPTIIIIATILAGGLSMTLGAQTAKPSTPTKPAVGKVAPAASQGPSGNNEVTVPDSPKLSETGMALLSSLNALAVVANKDCAAQESFKTYTAQREAALPLLEKECGGLGVDFRNGNCIPKQVAK